MRETNKVGCPLEDGEEEPREVLMEPVGENDEEFLGRTQI